VVLLLGAALVATIGSYATYKITLSHIQNQLVERSKLLASALNHSAMIANSNADLQHVVTEVLKDNADIQTIAVMLREDQRIIASQTSAKIKFLAKTDNHLWRELADAISTGEYGIHTEYNSDLILITPLWHALPASDTQSETGSPGSVHSSGHKMPSSGGQMPNMQHTMGGSTPVQDKNSRPSHTTVGNESDSKTNNQYGSDYRGGILLRLDRSSVLATMSSILQGLIPVSVIGILAILAFAYAVLHSQVISPITGIRNVMKRQQSGDRQARAQKQSSAELDDVATAFNGMIDAISESEKQYRYLFEGSIQGVYIHRNWEILFANPALADIFGYDSPEEILALGDVASLLSADEHDRLRDYNNARQKGEFAPDVYEARGVKKDGSVIWAEFRVTVIDWQRAPATQCVVIDITDRKKAESELIEHRDHLQKLVDLATEKLQDSAVELKEALSKEKKLSEMQRKFVSMASHEFRTPLAIIDTTAQRLKSQANKKELTPEDTVQRVEKIRSAVQRMTRLMESTLAAARIQEGKLKIEIESCDIGEVVREACTRQQDIASKHTISCNLAELPKIIQADTGFLEQILTNLLSNAVKYAPDAPDIEVKAFTDDDQVVISVRDHGLGIDVDDLQSMFQRFFRAKTSTGISGTGIGLNLVKMLVEEHGGTVEVESKKGEGSTFTVRLPITGPDQSEKMDTMVA
jgi:PAS domain S-box-containing protein